MIYLALTILLIFTAIATLLLMYSRKKSAAYPTPPPSPWVMPLRRRSDRIARQRIILKGTLYPGDSDDDERTVRPEKPRGRTVAIERKVFDWLEEFPEYPCDREIKIEPVTPTLPALDLPDTDTWLGPIELWEALYSDDLTDLSNAGDEVNAEEWDGNDGWGLWDITRT